MPTIRVACFVPSLRGGGAERVALNLLRAFSDRGLAADLVVCAAEGPYLSQIPPNVRLVDLNVSGVARAIPRLARYLRRERPLGLLAIMDHANIAAIVARALARVPTRVVASVHIAVSPHAQAVGGWRPSLVRRLLRWFYPHADAVVAVSRGVAEDLSSAARLPLDRIHIIHNPIVTVDLKEMAEQDPEHPWLRAGEPPVIVAVARLEPQKDLASLLRSFAIIRRDRPCRLLILGTGQLRDSLGVQAQVLGIDADVRFEGFLANPFAYMRRAAIVVMSSVYEGFGNVLVEAMACGTPVVSTDCPSGPREILDNGRYGLLVPTGASDELARAILATLDAPPAAAFLQRRAADFDAGTVAQRYLDLLVPQWNR